MLLKNKTLLHIFALWLIGGISVLALISSNFAIGQDLEFIYLPLISLPLPPQIQTELTNTWNNQSGRWITYSEESSLPSTVPGGVQINHDDFSLYEYRFPQTLDASELSFCEWESDYIGSTGEVSLATTLINGPSWVWYKQKNHAIINAATQKVRVDFEPSLWQGDKVGDDLAYMSEVNAMGFWVNEILGISNGTLVLKNLKCY